jgi:hypothetical protein
LIADQRYGGDCDATGLTCLQKPWRVSNPVNWFKLVRQDQQAPALEGLTFVPSEHTRYSREMSSLFGSSWKPGSNTLSAGERETALNTQGTGHRAQGTGHTAHGSRAQAGHRIWPESGSRLEAMAHRLETCAPSGLCSRPSPSGERATAGSALDCSETVMRLGSRKSHGVCRIL